MTTPSAPTFPSEEYDALQSGCGFGELPGWTRISLTGADRQTFLNSFCTNDVKRLAPGASCEAFFTNVKGKIIGHGLVTCRENELVILTVPDQAARLIEHFDRYRIREDVQFRDTTPEHAYLLLGGERAREIVRRSAPEIPATAPSMPALPHIAIQIGETPARCLTWPLFASHFACLLEVSTADAGRVIRALIDQGFIRCGGEAFTACRVEAGMPLFAIDFDENNLPQEVGRDAEAISFTKGCYLGQETVARIDAIGHVNQRIGGVRFLGREVPPVGIELSRAGTKAGRVTSAAFSPRLNAPLALAMVRREVGAIGSPLESAAGQCEIVSLPLDD